MSFIKPSWWSKQSQTVNLPVVNPVPQKSCEGTKRMQRAVVVATGAIVTGQSLQGLKDGFRAMSLQRGRIAEEKGRLTAPVADANAKESKSTGDEAKNNLDVMTIGLRNTQKRLCWDAIKLVAGVATMGTALWPPKK